MSRTPFRVLIVEDQPIFADALRLLLDGIPGIDIVGVAADGAEAIELAIEREAQVVLMDLGLPKVDGLEATRQLMALNPRLRVIAVTGQDEAGRTAALDAGASDYLVKGGIDVTIPDAIFRAMSVGETPLPQN